ncbi:MAG: hypothetical protein EP334_07255 [Gammaproteobacteria bacterium]|nr:MAG: hypothetical protein EP334_07255 [Gammaproteobacteria bacterium]
MTEKRAGNTQESEAFACGFREGFLGVGDDERGVSINNIHSALHWLDGWVEGSRWRQVGE